MPPPDTDDHRGPTGADDDPYLSHGGTDESPSPVTTRVNLPLARQADRAGSTTADADAGSRSTNRPQEIKQHCGTRSQNHGLRPPGAGDR